jgi:hypothetical protein
MMDDRGLTAEQKTEFEARLRKRMAEGPFTFGQLCVLVGEHDQGFRFADALIQKRRKKGEIAYTREKGNGVVWRETVTAAPEPTE